MRNCMRFLWMTGDGHSCGFFKKKYLLFARRKLWEQFGISSQANRLIGMQLLRMKTAKMRQDNVRKTLGLQNVREGRCLDRDVLNIRRIAEYVVMVAKIVAVRHKRLLGCSKCIVITDVAKEIMCRKYRKLNGRWFSIVQCRTS